MDQIETALELGRQGDDADVGRRAFDLAEDVSGAELRSLPPALEVALSSYEGTAPLYLTARAEVGQTTAPVYYTLGADNHGVYHNAVVAWELYGPGEEDYRIVTPPGLTPRVTATGGKFETEVEFAISRPGSYRLRAATVDSAGRCTIKWAAITVTP